jgi:hypothetical protein
VTEPMLQQMTLTARELASLGRIAGEIHPTQICLSRIKDQERVWLVVKGERDNEPPVQKVLYDGEVVTSRDGL